MSPLSHISTPPRPGVPSRIDHRSRLAADSAALAFDPEAQATSRSWWYWTKNDHARLVQILRGRPRAAQALAGLERDPRDLAAHRGVRDAVTEILSGDTDSADLTAALDTIERSARMGLHVGDVLAEAPDAPALTAQEILHGIDRPGPPPGEGPTSVTVVIPFKAGDPRDGRARNLAACLAGLADQDLPRDQYRVVVVESDSEPHWQSDVEPHVDRYLFAYNPGPFNKAWAVNCGAVHGGGPDDLLCILDADVLPDADLLSRGAGRFADDPTLQVHWPYRDIIFADAASSDRAVAARCVRHEPAVDHETVRGAFQRRPPGGCIWVRRHIFDRIGGMDERFEGWGGEDNDFAWRAEFLGGVERFGDTLIHLHHTRTVGTDAAAAPTRSPDHHWCTWLPTSDLNIGDLAKYRTDR